MTPDFWNTIQPQLDEQIADVLGDTCHASDLLTIITKPFWWQTAPFNKMKVEHEHNDSTFIQWLSSASSLVSESYADIFEDELRKRIADTIEAQWTNRMQDLADEYEAEMKEVA